MRNFFRLCLLAASAMTATSVLAQSAQPSEWWLVLDDGNAQAAHFVDMASIRYSDNGANISMMTVSRGGDRDMQTLTIDCQRVLGAQGDAAVKEFICGTAEYRERSGLILGPVSPDEMAAVVFAGQSSHLGGDSGGVA